MDKKELQAIANAAPQSYQHKIAEHVHRGFAMYFECGCLEPALLLIVAINATAYVHESLPEERAFLIGRDAGGTGLSGSIH